MKKVGLHCQNIMILPTILLFWTWHLKLVLHSEHHDFTHPLHILNLVSPGDGSTPLLSPLKESQTRRSEEVISALFWQWVLWPDQRRHPHSQFRFQFPIQNSHLLFTVSIVLWIWDLRWVWQRIISAVGNRHFKFPISKSRLHFQVPLLALPLQLDLYRELECCGRGQAKVTLTWRRILATAEEPSASVRLARHAMGCFGLVERIFRVFSSWMVWSWTRQPQTTSFWLLGISTASSHHLGRSPDAGSVSFETLRQVLRSTNFTLASLTSPRNQPHCFISPRSRAVCDILSQDMTSSPRNGWMVVDTRNFGLRHRAQPQRACPIPSHPTAPNQIPWHHCHYIRSHDSIRHQAAWHNRTLQNITWRDKTQETIKIKSLNPTTSRSLH